LTVLQSQVVILAQCENTLRERKISKNELWPFFSYVPSGNGEIIIRQYQGSAVVHPSLNNKSFLMNYTINKTVNKNFQQAVEDVSAELKKEGFGIITEIDLKEKFKEKLNVDFRNYKILGAATRLWPTKPFNWSPALACCYPAMCWCRKGRTAKLR
jgi:hypothetical protein